MTPNAFSAFPEYPAVVPRYLPPTNATNLQRHIELYGLPYGVLGVISHALTFYVIGCHFFGRRPLAPWMHMTKERFNLILTLLSSIVSVTLACITLARTRGSRPLLIIAAMQMLLGALVDVVAAHRYLIAKRGKGWDNWISLWALPVLVISIFSIYAFYQFKCKRPGISGFKLTATNAMDQSLTRKGNRGTCSNL